MRTLQDKEPSEPIATTISSQPESKTSEAKKEEVSLTTIKPSHNDSKDADARLCIVLWEILMMLSEMSGCSKTLSSCSFNSNVGDATTEQVENKENIPPANTEACTPKPPLQLSQGGKSMDLKKQQTARKIASLVRNPSALRPKNQSQSSQAKNSLQKSVKR